MSGKFNLNELLSKTSLQTPRDTADEKTSVAEAKGDFPFYPQKSIIKPLNIHDLVASESNFYSVDSIDELKNSIELFGVQQNLIVKPLPNGKYEIIAGHRRHRACMELCNEGKTEFEYVPCSVQSERDEIEERILLIMTNSTTRELSDYEKMKQAEELRKCFEALKKRDGLTGRVRDLVAEALNTSPTQIARMSAIEKNLSPEFTEEFKGGRLGLSAAYELSGMSGEKQKEAYTEYQEKGGLSIGDVKEKKQESAPVSSEEAPPKSYPETPPDFSEGQDAEQETPADVDFAEMTASEKAAAAVDFMNGKRFDLFKPGEDTRIFDFIIETLETIQSH